MQPARATMPDMSQDRATYQDVLDADPRFTAELIDGELTLMGRPTYGYNRASSRMSYDLTGSHGDDRRGGGWVILPEPELWLGPPRAPNARVLVPDIAGWRRERFQMDPTAVGHLITPDWVCEILSPSTVRHDRIRKMAIYAEVGVPFAWIVDPIAHTVEVFELVDGRWTIAQTAAGDVTAALPPFADTPFDLGPWWGSPPPG